MANEPIRWGMIGCGEVAERKSGPAFSAVHGSTLYAVASRDPTRAAGFARRHGVPRVHGTAHELIRDDDVDAVYVATPTSSHCEYVLLAAEAKKAVCVEKPMAMNLAECLSMARACRRAGVPLWVAYYRRALGRVARMKRWLEEGRIGEPRFVQSVRYEPLLPSSVQAWRSDPSIAGGGLFFEGICHTFDLLDYLFGPITDVHGVGNGHCGMEETVAASYRFASGVVGSGTWCFSTSQREDADEIVGSEGRIRFSISRPVPIVIETDSGRYVEHLPDPTYVHQPLIASMVAELRGVGKCASTDESAIRTATVVDTILAGVQEAG